MKSAVRALLAAGLCAVALSGCVPQQVRPVPPTPAQTAGAMQAQQAREAKLRAQPGWSLSGRLAVSTGKRGGSGRIDWDQRGPGYQIVLSAPVTRQSWRLEGDDRSVRLEGVEGGPREGDDAETLLLDATGWRIPVASLPDWVRGLATPDADGAPRDAVEFSADGRLRQISQAGWVIEYPEWYPADAHGVEMPRRIVARRDGAMIRLVIDQWNPRAP
ncbi:lipoprotein insertase outer membrane protein LolB [Lysobacter fragariae]